MRVVANGYRKAGLENDATRCTAVALTYVARHFRSPSNPHLFEMWGTQILSNPRCSQGRGDYRSKALPGEAA